MLAFLTQQWRFEYHLLAMVIAAGLFVSASVQGRTATRLCWDTEDKLCPSRRVGLLLADCQELLATAKEG